MDESRLTVQVHRGACCTTVVTVAGQIDLVSTAQLEEVLMPLVEHGTTVLDAAAITLLDSYGLRLIVKANRIAHAHGALLRIAAAPPAVIRVLGLAGADQFLEVFTTVEQALAK